MSESASERVDKSRQSEPGATTATSGRATATKRGHYLLWLQRKVGNQTVAGLIQGSGGGASAPIIQRNPVEDAISQKSPDAINGLSDADLTKASVDQRVQMIDIILGAGGGTALRRLWDSFGGDIESVANGHAGQWQQSLTQFPDVMRQSYTVQGVRAAFTLEVSDVAWAYLRENDGVVKNEMQRLGIPEKEGDSTATTNAQDEALQKAQAAAGDLSRTQKARQQLRQTEIAYHIKPVEKGGTELPQGGVEDIEKTYTPVFFDPDQRFDAADQATDYLMGIRSWDDTYKEHVRLTKLIQSYYTANPALYALSRSDESGDKPEAVSKLTPADARKQLGEKLRDVRENIAKTQGMVPTLAIQMTPIHDQMLSGHVGAGAALKHDWTKPFCHAIAQDRITQEQPGPWWEQLGLAALEAAAFVVVGLASGGIGPVLLAGGQAAISIGKYQSLEAASQASVKSDTVLIQDGQVVAAAAEAIISTALAFIAAVAAARGALALRMASQAGRVLAADLGEDVARRLLMELTPDAAQALKAKLGADALKDLALRMGGGSIEKLAQDLAGVEIRTLLDQVGWEALEKLSKGLAGKEIQGLAQDLSGAVLRNLGEELAGADIKAMMTKHGVDGVKWLAKDLPATAARKLADQLTVDALKALQDLTAKEAADLVDSLTADTVNALAAPLKGKGLKELAALNMFNFHPDSQALLKAGKGAAVRALGDIDGLPLVEIRAKLASAGFNKIAAERGQEIWAHGDGSIVRMKIASEAFTTMRPGPHLVREISKKAGAFGTKDIFAKVTADGAAIPAGTNFAKEGLRQWFSKAAGRAPSPAELDTLMKVWADAGHADIGQP